MKKMLIVLLTLSALNTLNTGLAASVPQAVVIADSGKGEPLGEPLFYSHLLTECAWQGLALPAETMAALGDPARITLTTQDLPDNVHVSLRSVRTTGVVGLSVSRTDRTQAVHQTGRLTLTNPASGYIYTVQALIIGDARAEK